MFTHHQHANELVLISLEQLQLCFGLFLELVLEVALCVVSFNQFFGVTSFHIVVPVEHACLMLVKSHKLCIEFFHVPDLAKNAPRAFAHKVVLNLTIAHGIEGGILRFF